MSADPAVDPVGTLRDVRKSIGGSIDPMRAAALQTLTKRCITYEWADHGKNSDAMRNELAAMSEACRMAADASGDSMWTTMRTFFREIQLSLR